MTAIIMKFNVSLEDNRDQISQSIKGAYFVQKKKIIARFSFGLGEGFHSAFDAHAAMILFLAGRCDSESLFVNLVEFE